MYEPVSEEEIQQNLNNAPANVYPPLQEEKQCRICLETTDPSDLIHPCQCRGFSKYVHRSCLDQWRVQNNHQHYYACDVCHYEYRLSRVWWARIVSHKATSIIGTLVALPTIGLIAGYGSASLYNWGYYYLMHDVYHVPHRLQTIFHCLMWLGIPGIVGMIRSLFRGIRNHAIPELPAQRAVDISTWVELLASISRSTPSVVHHYHHDTTVRKRKERDENDDEDSDEGKETKSKIKKKSKKLKTPVAECPDHNATTIAMLVAGTAGSFYFTFRWMYEKGLALSKRCAEYIANV